MAAPTPTLDVPDRPHDHGTRSRWQSMAATDVAAQLEVDVAAGLDEAAVRSRQQQHGPNRLIDPPRRPRWLRFADQFRSAIVYILAGAAVLAAAVGDWKDPIVIAAVLFVNGVLGYVQEARAEGALAALREMLATTSKVRRGGALQDVPAEDLVPGDLVVLEAGDRIPADGRFVLTANATVDESSLTGESVPVDKDAELLLADDLPLADRRNLGYMNTTLVRGRAELLVTATGMATAMGEIAEQLHEQEPPRTPLQHQLGRLSTRLAALAGVAVAAVFALRLAQGDAFADALLASVALAVAAIPEGLPAVVTVTLAVGVSQMARRQAIVKRLHSVETLGATTVICSDKTGTLTVNQMTASKLAVGDRTLDVTGTGYELDGHIVDDADEPTDLRHALRAALLANDASVDGGTLVGDSTEGALVVLAAKGGVDPDMVRSRWPRIAEVPFDSATKLMATFHRDDDDVLVCVKGAPEVVLDRCARWRQADGSELDLDDAEAADRRQVNEDLAGRGLRVLAVASRRLTHDEYDDAADDLEQLLDGLTLEALVGLVDPPRPEAARAIALCRAAGIEVKMITGDHASTAGAIAAQLGIEGRVLSGVELDRLSDDELRDQIADVGVCARVAPEHKVRVVHALRANGHVVAMTGDGVNDAAALRAADIGVAMGITGTEVTKEAGDMVLADDNFATIVGAVERGRTIYANIVKFVRFQLTTNLAAIGTILGASLLGMPVPLSAIQVLWVNIIADGPPAMTLGVDPPEPDVMDRAPRPTDSTILTPSRLGSMLYAAGFMTLGTLGLFNWAEGRYGTDVASTMAFSTFVLFQLANVFNARSDRRSVFGRYTLHNRTLWYAVGAVTALQVLAVAWPPLQGVFGTEPLSAGQWLVCIAVASTVVVAEEARKFVSRL